MNVLKRVILIALVISITAVCGACRQSVPPASQPPAASVPEAPTDPTENTEPTATVPVTEPEPESVSILDFLRIAMQPVGQTMYVWGGGWNEADTGAGAEAVTLGVSPRWAEFAAKQDSSYSYENTKYQIHDGPAMLAGQSTIRWKPKMGRQAMFINPQRCQNSWLTAALARLLPLTKCSSGSPATL